MENILFMSAFGVGLVGYGIVLLMDKWKRM